MHPSEFFNDQGLYAGLLALWHTLRHALLNAGQRVMFRMLDNRVDGEFDEVAPGQAKGVGFGFGFGFGQILLDGRILLCRALITPEIAYGLARLRWLVNISQDVLAVSRQWDVAGKNIGSGAARVSHVSSGATQKIAACAAFTMRY